MYCVTMAQICIWHESSVNGTSGSEWDIKFSRRCQPIQTKIIRTLQQLLPGQLRLILSGFELIQNQSFHLCSEKQENSNQCDQRLVCEHFFIIIFLKSCIYFARRNPSSFTSEARFLFLIIIIIIPIYIFHSHLCLNIIKILLFIQNFDLFLFHITQICIPLLKCYCTSL